MDLTARQRQLVFALIVAVLAALGAFLFRSGAGGQAGPERQRPQEAATSSAAPASQPAAPASTSPAAPAAPAGVDIYRWVPFTRQDLAAAAGLVTRFAAEYGSYNYRQSAAQYAGRLRGLATSQLAEVIASGYAAPGVSKLREAQRQVSAGTAVIDSLRAFGPSSLTFVVTVRQVIREAARTSRQSTRYAVTVTAGGGRWQVSDIELASAGNS